MCGLEKPLDDFFKRNTSADGRGTSCKECLRPGMRAKILKKKYDMTLEEYDDWLESQNCGCGICTSLKTFTMGAFMIDHDHRCHPQGRGCKDCIRGLLCNKCNVMVEWMLDNITALNTYLAPWGYSIVDVGHEFPSKEYADFHP